MEIALSDVQVIEPSQMFAGLPFILLPGRILIVCISSLSELKVIYERKKTSAIFKSIPLCYICNTFVIYILLVLSYKTNNPKDQTSIQHDILKSSQSSVFIYY